MSNLTLRQLKNLKFKFDSYKVSKKISENSRQLYCMLSNYAKFRINNYYKQGKN